MNVCLWKQLEPIDNEVRVLLLALHIATKKINFEASFVFSFFCTLSVFIVFEPPSKLGAHPNSSLYFSYVRLCIQIPPVWIFGTINRITFDIFIRSTCYTLTNWQKASRRLVQILFRFETDNWFKLITCFKKLRGTSFKRN